MKKRTKKYFEDYHSSVQNLQDTFTRSSDDDIVIDAAIKRFEICYELSWKLLKAYLSSLGINCKNPRECFKQAKANELIKDEIGWLEMIEDRNLLVHTYSLKQSRKIFGRIKNNHFKLLENLSEEIGSFNS